MEHFFPQIQVKTKNKNKKKGFINNGTLFSSNSSGHLRTPESNYWGNADVNHTQTIGGDTAKLLGVYTVVKL